MVLMRRSRRWIVLACGAVMGGVVVGGVVAAEFREVVSPPQLQAAIDGEPLRRVADIPAEAGRSGRGVFLQPTSAGFLCLWDAPSATSPQRQGGCNPSSDPLGGRAVSISLAYDGGPSVAGVTDARLIGLAAPEVAEVQVVMSDTSRRRVRLEKAEVDSAEYMAFGYRFKKADLRRGIAPVAVVALDMAGQEIDRQPTGFAG